MILGVNNGGVLAARTARPEQTQCLVLDIRRLVSVALLEIILAFNLFLVVKGRRSCCELGGFALSILI